jgi:hypothetical protein
MTQLRFDPDLHSGEVRSVSLPIEVRRPDLSLVHASLSDRMLEVASGSYYVTARLPAGQELTGYIEVRDEAFANVRLTLDPADVSPKETEEAQRYLWGLEAADPRDGLLALDDAAERRFRLIPYMGSPLGDEEGFSPAQRDRVKFDGRPGVGSPETLALSATGELSLVQLHSLGAVPKNAVVPGGHAVVPGGYTVGPNGRAAALGGGPAGDVARIIVRFGRGKAAALTVRPSHPTADALVGFGQQSMIAEAARVASGEAAQAEDLLLRKREDPVAAAVGGYVLLRLGDLARLHNWTKNLAEWFPSLPDGAVIRGEHLLRMHQHVAGLEMLLALEDRGLPLFTDGLTIAIRRLRQYAAAAPRVPNKHSERAARLLIRLSHYATQVDFAQPTVTFSGGDPNRPGSAHIGLDPTWGYDLGPMIDERRADLRQAIADEGGEPR